MGPEIPCNLQRASPDLAWQPGSSPGQPSSTHSELIPQTAVFQLGHAAVGDAEVPASEDLVTVTLEVLLTPDQVDFEPFHRPDPKTQASF